MDGIHIELDGDLRKNAEDALPEGMTLSCLFALVEAMQASPATRTSGWCGYSGLSRP